MKDTICAFTPQGISSVNGRAIDGRAGYTQGFTDDKGSFVAILIPCPKKDMDSLLYRIRNVC